MKSLHRNRTCYLRHSVVIASLAFVTAAHAATNVVLYTYDAAGNIVAMQRSDPVAIVVSGFTPGTGPVGATVTVSGIGFSATTTANGVTFNGVVATVAAATATALTIAVPVGATTGRIAVTVGGNTATSTQDFVVVTPGAPTIAGFSPMAGPAGTAASATGTNLAPDADTRLGAPIALPNGSIFRESLRSAAADVDRTHREVTP